jgi:hydroxylamine reductase
MANRARRNAVFCYQCEQTLRGTACTDVAKGVCGKTDEVAALQDLLLHVAEGVSMYAHRARALGAKSAEIDAWVLDALFTTVTNVNFDAEAIARQIRDGHALLGQAKALYEQACRNAGHAPETLRGAAAFVPGATTSALVVQGGGVAITARLESLGPDITGLQELLTYGVKGMAAYAHHALVLGKSDEAVMAFTHEALDFLTRRDVGVSELLGMNLKCGEVSVKVLALLDAANTGAYGHPVPTPVPMGHVPGKCILVSGHDLLDLEALLKQTEGKGINIYTHGEMLPAHGYPELKKYKHLVGNFGGAWMDQRKEFPDFHGAILMTTNCLQEPRENYKGRIFTSGLVGWPDVTHIADRNFAPVIDAALAAPGFTDTVDGGTHIVGFGHNAVLGVANTVISAVKSGAIKRFVLIGGCDGAETGRNYYSDLADEMPKDWVVLTLGCGKFRVVGHDLGTIGGLPRLLDMGQCNDSFSAIRVAQALAQAFGTDVNGLPLNLVLSWYEQKAVCVLLALLHLGVKNIRIGPKLPAFVTPAVLKVLVDTFNVMPIGTVEGDLKAMAA